MGYINRFIHNVWVREYTTDGEIIIPSKTAAFIELYGGGGSAGTRSVSTGAVGGGGGGGYISLWVYNLETFDKAYNGIIGLGGVAPSSGVGTTGGTTYLESGEFTFSGAPTGIYTPKLYAAGGVGGGSVAFGTAVQGGSGGSSGFVSSTGALSVVFAGGAPGSINSDSPIQAVGSGAGGGVRTTGASDEPGIAYQGTSGGVSSSNSGIVQLKGASRYTNALLVPYGAGGDGEVWTPGAGSGTNGAIIVTVYK